ncbi:MAG: PilZ domain-containing protein [Planctomycetota bacterium]|nr:PilZ domain-containing protein [Planctomycetota bacterium]
MVCSAGEDKASVERRSTKRRHVRLPARVSLTGGPFSSDTGLVEDISETGMRVHIPATREDLSKEALREDYRIKVTLIDELGDVVFRGSCKLIWHKTVSVQGRGGRRFSYLLGLKIDEGSFFGPTLFQNRKT